MNGIQFNNIVTTIGALVALVAAIFSAVNKGKIERLDQQVAALNYREKTEQASATFANVFLDKVLPDPQLKENTKHVQALLYILNVIAQASASLDGKSDVKARAMMPLQLALLLGQPGGVAAMDPDYKYLDDWVATALSDDSHATRVTAIQALTGLCQKALREKRLDILAKGVQAVDQLLALIPEDQGASRASSVAARSQLASFITKEDRLLQVAMIPGGDMPSSEKLRAEIRLAFPDANAAAQETKTSLQSTYAKLEDSTKPADVQKLVELKEGLAKIDAALKTASQVKIQTTINSAQANLPNNPNGGTTDASEAAINKILPDLASPDQEKRHKARSDLALFGQSAIKPLLKEVAKRAPTNSNDDYRTRLGIAVALQAMRQPINLDNTDAYWIVSLLRSNDDQTRHATAEFLMNLESGEAVKNSFNALEVLFYEMCESPKSPNGNTVGSIAAVTGTWARNISPDTDSRDPGKSFPAFALEAAKKWRDILNGSRVHSDWGPVLAILNDLIKRAEHPAPTARMQQSAPPS